MLKRGTKLGKYRIARKIGTGGMADVYQAHDTSLGRDAALKVIPPEFARDKQRLKRFEKEVRSAAALTHPGIVALYDVGKTDDIHYFAMALLGGGDLKARIRKGIEPNEAIRIVRRIAEALGYAHAKGFIHRDVKPENILFDDEGRWPILTDMGIAKAINSDTRLTATGMSIGTPHYMSPEQAKGKGLDKRSDLYSLGVVFFEMLTGRVPFDAEDSLAIAYAHVNDPVPPLPPSLQRFQPIIDVVLAKSPKQRYSNAAGFIGALDALSGTAEFDAATQVAPAAGETVMLRASGPHRRLPASINGWRWGLAGGLIAAAIVAVFVLLERPSTPRDGGDSISTQSTAPTSPTQPPPAASAGEQPAPPPAKGLTESTAESSTPDLRVAELEARLKEMEATQRKKTLRREKQRSEQLAGLLSQARSAFAELRIDESTTRDPAPLYRQALALEPKNADARSGLEQLLRWYLSRSALSSEQNDIEKARDYLARAAAIDPDSTAVAARQAVLGGPAAEIKRLLGVAGEAFAALRLTTPAENNALHYYREVLKLDPDSSDARTGVRRIVGRYVALARAAHKKGEADRAKTNLDKASAIDPEDARIAAFRNELNSVNERARADSLRVAEAQRQAKNLQTGIGAHRNRDYPTALGRLQPLAEQGVARAQFAVGLMFYRGQGTPRDEIQARQWIGRAADEVRQAADKGEPWAQNALGLMQREGLGAAQDTGVAMAWFQRAASQGYAPAQQNLGAGYETGSGIAKDPIQAGAWYEKAAAQGLAEAAFRHGALLEHGLGVPEDPARAAQLYTSAAEAGIGMAQLRLAQMYHEGRGLAQDYGAAEHWYRAAAEQGQAPAQAMLGEMLVHGREITADPASGTRWLENAAQQGNAGAQYELGLLYRQGEHVGQDDARAVQLFSTAAQQDHAAAQNALGIMYSQGRGVTQDDAEALNWFRKSAQQGLARGQYNVGLYFETGREVKQNYATALDWYTKAAAGGHEEAAGKLSRLSSATIVGGFASVSGRLDDLTGKQAYGHVAKELDAWLDARKIPHIPLPIAVAEGTSLKPKQALQHAQQLSAGNPLLLIRLTLPAGTNRLSAQCYTADGKRQWSFGRTVEADEAQPVKKLFRKLVSGLKSRLGKPCLARPAQQG